jgi:ABC-type antimicrobial peptide transport system permease subunit
MAKQLWPGENAIGKRLIVTARYIGPLGKRVVAGDEHEVVGVVGDVKNTSLRSAAEPAIYFSARQFPFRKMFIVVRGAGEPSQLAALVRDEVHRLDPSLPLGEVGTMERVLGASVDPPRFVMFLMLVFAALALALATVGIYGVLTYTVSHRRREFGIRLALGAQPGAVLGMIVREGLGLAVLGCAIGVAAAWAGGRSLSTFLYGVAPWDPATLAAVVAVVLAIATAACLAPGRRASGEDPAGALRVD